ncbi:MAG: ankyrin repeat domain-containing protein [Pyrinomonadaceae bacterium]
MKRLAVAVTLALLVVLSGCAEARREVRREARNPETDALLQAARGGHAETVRSILAGGRADVNGRDEGGDTPLIVAARAGHDDVVQSLLVARADPNVKNDGGQTALAAAAAGGHDEVVRLLKQAGASQ